MNQLPVTPGTPTTRTPVFFRITIAVLALLLLVGAAGAVLLVFEAKHINQQGGWGWLLVGAVYFIAIIVVCFVCALCTAVSLYRREPHRGLSIVILVISSLVVFALGANLIRTSIRRHLRHAEMAQLSKATPQPPADSLALTPMPTGTANSSSTLGSRDLENPQILELRSRLWEAIRTKNADAFVDCFYIEERFNTPEVRQENRNQVELLLRGKTLEVEVRKIPATELVEIAKIQRAKSVSGFRYSLEPGMILRIQQEALNGIVGRSFLIGEKNGKWHIITLAGHTT
jgi:hypothetical protein